MTQTDRTVADLVQDYYTASTHADDFASILSAVPVSGTTALADLIEADGRWRIRFGKQVDLDRYLKAGPQVRMSPEALDAAIDMALRAQSTTGPIEMGAIEELVDRFPDIEAPIRDAAALSEALWSTITLKRHVQNRTVKSLPCDFGPPTEDDDHRYELRELLGEGAFGQVYLAIDRQLSEANHDALVSIKVLPGRDRSSLARQLLIDEAAKARRVEHPNVVRVLDRGVTDMNEDFIVYEFVDGGDLAKWMRRNRSTLSVRDAVDLVAKIARGVHAAQMAGLVHCDLKPGNIMMTSTSEPKVADFGVAVRSDQPLDVPTAEDNSGQPLGNMAFMSPEQYRMEPGALTIPSDIYAMGGILFWMLTGELPNGATLDDVRRTHDPHRGRTQSPALRSLCPEVDRDLESVCQRAMAIRPEDRHASTAALAEDLEAWLGHKPIAWMQPSPIRRLTLWRRRKPGLALTVAILIVVLIASAIAVERLIAAAEAQRVAAEEERLQAARAESKLEGERSARRSYMNTLRKYRDNIQAKIDGGLAEDLLMQVWLVEGLYGPVVLDNQPKVELWDLRINHVRKLLERAYASGRGDEIDTLLWETSQGYWLLRNGNAAEAEAILQENLRKWRLALTSGDDWIRNTEALLAASTVQCLFDLATGDALSASDRARLTALRTVLDDADNRLMIDASGTPLHQTLLAYRLRLFSPVLLDDPELHMEISARLEALGD